MATHAANVYREAELKRRLTQASERLAGRFDVAFPPPFPHARDEYYRRNDELERVVLFVEALDRATSEGHGDDG